ncbi:MAG: phosphatidylserine decarboxylase [Gammaproteobacteria bacterium]|nr:phosphatidylserine decarboxylase [Gammaproteobacteria bacterium]MBL4728842.1 phosphatidylserine decarboxylase [Gammaproteobacteria bacterium]
MSHLFILFQYLLPHHLLSRGVGVLAQSHLMRKLFIRAFIKRYKVDMSQARIQEIGQFKNFNAFFTRELQAGARPLASIQGAIVCPADGTISQLGNITDGNLLQAKGRHYSCEDLLAGDTQMAELFQAGKFATIYLSPRDYHRVHMPMAGALKKTIYVPGKLFSVNQTTADSVPNLFARNERLICLFDTEVGPMAVILVGAMIVAGIDTVWAGEVCPTTGKREIKETNYTNQAPAVELPLGGELGRFRLGSTAIVLFPHGTVKFETSLKATSSIAMGQLLGQVVSTHE